MENTTGPAFDQVERIEITTLVDNYVDLMLTDTAIVKRPLLSSGTHLPTKTLIAEHGLSLFVSTHKAAKMRNILFDSGYNFSTLFHNVDLLDVDIESITAIVVSHAHMDHAGALYMLSDVIDKPLDLVAHPQIFAYPRFLEDKNKNRLFFPKTYTRNEIAAAGFNLIESKVPTCIAGGAIMVTGEVERSTSFEKGLPNAYLQTAEGTQKDDILDDQSIIMHLQGRGLVIVCGCAHAGVVNTVRYAKKVTGVDKVYALLGGFHLSGALFEPIIEETIAALKQIQPEIIVPMHCTGFTAIAKMAKAFPDAFILNSVGSKFTLV